MDNKQIDADLNSTNFKIGEILNHAWENVNGAKAAIIITSVAMLVVAFILQMIVHKLFGIDAKKPPYISAFIVMPIITNIFVAPFYAGMIMTGIKRLRAESIHLGSSFGYFNYFIPLAITWVVVSFIASLPIMIVNLPILGMGIGHVKAWADLIAGLLSSILYTFFLLSLPLVIEKNYSPTMAMAQSCKLIKPYWIKIFALILIGYLFLIAATIPTFIGSIFNNATILVLGMVFTVIALIWLVPFIFLIQGNVYLRLVDKN